MKKIIIFILGVITGIVLVPFVDEIVSEYNETAEKYNNPYHIKGLSMLPEKGDCIVSNDIEIFQTLTKGIALAHPTYNFDKLILLVDNDEKLFYDGEQIKIPAQKCAKQIGVYTYETKAEIQRTVPAVIIE